jgi:hypothetical protein
MSLLKRKASPAQQSASRSNSLRSTGPRTESGKSISRRNAVQPHGFPPVTALSMLMLSMQALGEDYADFEQLRQALSEAMGPRDYLEAAWVEDIALLRWRLLRLQRAESGILALKKRKLEIERVRKALPHVDPDDTQGRALVRLRGLTGMADSAAKFRDVLEMLRMVREMIQAGNYDKHILNCFTGLYGETPGFQQSQFRICFEELLKERAEKKLGLVEGSQNKLLADLDKEIANYDQLRALYAEEHLEESPLRQDAAMLPPREELDDVIRYEAHLENQIERKLRQFYARRREPMLRRAAEALTAAAQEPSTGESVGETAPFSAAAEER